MSRVKEIDRLCNEIADELSIHPDTINLSQVVGGWLADVNVCGLIISFESSNAVEALEGLLDKCRERKVS